MSKKEQWVDEVLNYCPQFLNSFDWFSVACICITTKTWRHHSWADWKDKTSCEGSWQYELPQNKEDTSQWPHWRTERRRRQLCGWKWWWWQQVRSGKLSLVDLSKVLCINCNISKLVDKTWIVPHASIGTYLQTKHYFVVFRCIKTSDTYILYSFTIPDCLATNF